MLRVMVYSLPLMFLGVGLVVAQDEEKIVSGPQKGVLLPAPFESFNINGPAKGRLHCLVCKFALNPSVLIFAKEPAEGKDEALNMLLKQLDEMAAELQERNLSVGVIFLSPDAMDSTNNPQAEKADEIIKETVNREALIKRLTARAEKLKHVIVGYYISEGPKGYKLNPKADVTILFYERLKILENFAFLPDMMQANDVESVVRRVRAVLQPKTP